MDSQEFVELNINSFVVIHGDKYRAPLTAVFNFILLDLQLREKHPEDEEFTSSTWHMLSSVLDSYLTEVDPNKEMHKAIYEYAQVVIESAGILELA